MRRRRTIIVVLALAFTLLLSGIAAVVYARHCKNHGGCGSWGTVPPGDVYYGYGETTDDIGQVFKVWVEVDTRYDRVKVRYEGHALALRWLPGGFYGAFIGVKDDKGWCSPEVEVGGYYGTKFFWGYNNSETWVYATVLWNYVGALPVGFYLFHISCKAAVHVGA